MIHALTYRMTGSLADAEDVAQDAFVRAFDQLGSFRGDAKFSSWLYRIAVHACLNWRQREQRRRSDSSGAPSPSGEAEDAATKRICETALGEINGRAGA